MPRKIPLFKNPHMGPLAASGEISIKQPHRIRLTQVGILDACVMKPFLKVPCHWTLWTVVK